MDNLHIGICTHASWIPFSLDMFVYTRIINRMVLLRLWRRVFGTCGPFVLATTLCAYVFLTQINVDAQQTTVNSTSSANRALKSASPGSSIWLLPGVYDGGIVATNLHGTAEQPISIRGVFAENPPVIRGGNNGLHFSTVSHLILEDLVVEKSAWNGINIDDADNHGDPSHHVTMKNVLVRDVGNAGNHDGIKLSGIDDFLIYACQIKGWGKVGEGIDLVGCHRGRIEKCRIDGHDVSAVGLQCKGGSSEIVVEDCDFLKIRERAVQIGGRTDLQLFRPKPEGFEARSITVRDCRFNRGEAAVTFVNADSGVFERNVIYRPQRYVVRILQEQTSPEFLPSRNGQFIENIVVWRGDELVGGVANVGFGTAPETFEFTNNFWYREDAPQLSLPKGFPTPELDSILGQDPKLIDSQQGDLRPSRSRKSMRTLAKSQPIWRLWLPWIGRLAGLIASALVGVGLVTGVRWLARTRHQLQFTSDQLLIHPSICSTFGTLAMASTVLAVYGSLVPLDYHPKPFNETWQQFLRTPYLHLDIYHLADWVANVLLFVPMSYFGVAALAMRSRSISLNIAACLFVWLVCAALAVAVEFSQLWFPPRTVSQNDILAESIGSAIGCLSAALTAGWVGRWLSRALASVRPLQMADFALQIYVLAFLIYAVMPLDLALTADALALKWKSGRISWLWPGASPLTWLEFQRFLLDAAPAVPIGVWIGRRLNPRGLNRNWLMMGLVSFVIALLVEGAQVFIFSRYASLSAAIFATIGMIVGTQLASLLSRQFDGWWTTSATVSRRHKVLIFIGCYAALLIYLLAQPQKWRALPSAMNRLQDFWTPPFSALYWGSEFNALTRVSQAVLLFVPLGFGLADLCFATANSMRSWRRTLTSFFGLAIFATALELVQAWVPESTIDNTSSIAYIFGALIGYISRDIIHNLAIPKITSNFGPSRLLNMSAVFGMITAAGCGVIFTFLMVREGTAWNQTLD